MVWKKLLGAAAGSLAGDALIGGELGAIAGGIAGSAVASGGIDFEDAAIGGLVGFGVSEFDLGSELFGGGIGGGEVAGAAAEGASTGATTAGDVAAKAGSAGTGKGLLSKVTGGSLLSNPLVGYTALGIGQELVKGDPAVQAGRARERELAAERGHYAANYKTVAPPSTGSYVRDPETGQLRFKRAA